MPSSNNMLLVIFPKHNQKGVKKENLKLRLAVPLSSTDTKGSGFGNIHLLLYIFFTFIATSYH